MQTIPMTLHIPAEAVAFAPAPTQPPPSPPIADAIRVARMRFGGSAIVRTNEGGGLMSTSTPKSELPRTLDSPSRSTGRLGKGQPVSAAADLRPGVHSPPLASDGRARHFLRHFGEMFLAMLVGMWSWQRWTRRSSPLPGRASPT
jgi:hypothetical protein